MEPTTQAALVSALLALLVLLLGLARRDRRRRDAGHAEPPVVAQAQKASDPADDHSRRARRRAKADAKADAKVAKAQAKADAKTAKAQAKADAKAAKADTKVEAKSAKVEAKADAKAAKAQAKVEAKTAKADAKADAKIDTAHVPVTEASEPIETVAPRGLGARRRARRQASTLAGDAAAVAPVSWPSLYEIAAQAAAAEAPLVEDAADPLDVQEEDRETAEQAELRALRAQVRTLEEVLQDQLAEHPTGLALVQRTNTEPEEAYLRQVSLVVRGLAEHTAEDESPHRTLARVAAAVERLGVPNSMARPVLPLPSDPPPHPRLGGPWKPSHRREAAELVAPATTPEAETIPFPGNVATLAEAPVPVEPVPQSPVPSVTEQVVQPVAEQVAPAVTQPVMELVTEPLEAVEPTVPDFTLAASAEAEVVLPVPPPAQSQPQPNRRRFRR